MSEAAKESLHKEFELERMILFSDAVFAIAITLLILEIKFPELPKSFKGINVFDFFKPVAIHLFAFTISFFFIGSSWARHLNLCKFLNRYNNTVIFLNLLLLFFIVTFPFSISCFLENVKNNLLIAVFLYMLNIFLVVFAQFLFAHYVLVKNTSLSVNDQVAEKKYFYLKARYSFFMLLTGFIVVAITAILTHGALIYTAASLYVLPVLSIIVSRKLKKYKPAKQSGL